MLGMGGATKYSIAIGEKNNQLGSRIYTSLIILGSIIGFIFTFLGIILGKPLLHILGADANIMNYAYEYFITIVAFSIPFILNTITVCFLRNDGHPNLSMIAMLAGIWLSILVSEIITLLLSLYLLNPKKGKT